MPIRLFLAMFSSYKHKTGPLVGEHLVCAACFSWVYGICTYKVTTASEVGGADKQEQKLQRQEAC